MKKLYYRTILRLCLVLITIGISTSTQAQWGKPVTAIGISGQTYWDAMYVDSTGTIYTAGISDKLPSPNTRKIVISKYDKNFNKIWNNSSLIGGSTIYHSSIGVDAKGNTYAIGLFTANSKVTRADASFFTSPFKGHWVTKIDATGKDVWSKRLVIEDYSNFKVFADGSFALLATRNQNNIDWGDSVINVANDGGKVFLEFNTNGGLIRATNINTLSHEINFISAWTAPGEIAGISAPFAYGPTKYISGKLNLATKTFTPIDTASIAGTQSNNFSVTQVQYEEQSKHYFFIVSAYQGKAIINKKDTLGPWTNNDIRDMHLVEFDEKMNVIHKIKLTNPFGYTIGANEIAILANIKATGGFTSPTGTIITKKGFDGAILYAIDRKFAPTRHAVIESKGSNIYTDANAGFDKDGDIYVRLMAGGDLYYNCVTDTVFFQAALSSTASKTILSKLTNNVQAVLTPNALNNSWSVFPNPTTSRGTISYTLTKESSIKIIINNYLGQSIATIAELNSSAGNYEQEFDTSLLPNGSYLIQIIVDGIPQIKHLTIIH